MSKFNVTGRKNAKYRFRAYLRQKWIDLRQTKMVSSHSTHFVEYISPAEMFRFVIFVCNYTRGAAYRRGHLAVHLQGTCFSWILEATYPIHFDEIKPSCLVRWTEFADIF